MFPLNMVNHPMFFISLQGIWGLDFRLGLVLGLVNIQWVISRVICGLIGFYLQEMMTALKDHSNRVKNVRTNLDDQMKPKAKSIIENIAKKEETSR